MYKRQVQESCLERKCPKCKQKEIIFNGYFENDSTSFEKWILKKVTIVKGTAKSVNRTLKEKRYVIKKI